jgi:hypothetical protein
LVGVVMLVVSISPTANAAPALDTFVDAEEILWVSASVSEPSTGVVIIKVMSPRSGAGERTVWQRCALPYGGPGRFRCGIDVSAGSSAAKRDGRWVAKLQTKQTVLDRTYFRTATLANR